MYGRGNQFFARAGLTQQEDGRTGRRHLVGLRKDLPQGPALADDALVATECLHFLPKVDVLLAQPVAETPHLLEGGA